MLITLEGEGCSTADDKGTTIKKGLQRNDSLLLGQNPTRLPVYASCGTFQIACRNVLADEASGITDVGRRAVGRQA